MTDIQKKIDKIQTIMPEVQEAQRVLTMKSGLMDDIMRDLLVREFGQKLDEAGTINLPLQDLIKIVYEKGYRDGRTA